MKSKSLKIWIGHPRIVVLIWLALALALGAGGFITGFNTFIPGPSSRDALLSNPGERLALKAGIVPHDELVLIITHPTLHNDQPAFLKIRDEIVHELRESQGAASGAKLFSNVQTAGYAPIEDLDHIYLSNDKRGLLIQARTVATLDNAADELEAFPQQVKVWERKYPEFSFWYLSQGTSDAETLDLIHRDLDRSLVYTIPLTLCILLWAFGSFGAALIPLGVALVSLVGALGSAAILSQLFGPISATASQLVVLLVLAIGVDYPLFVVNRVREEVRRGSSYPVAVAHARTHTGIAVFWSGLTVAISLMGLLLMDDSILTSMALVSITAVVVTAGGILWGLPSLLLLMDRRVEWGKVRNIERSKESMPPGRWLGLSLRRPVLVVIVGLLALLAAGGFATKLRLGNTFEPELLPQSLQGTKAFEVLEKRFPDLSGSDFAVVLQGTRLDALDDDGALQPFIEAILSFPQVRGPTQIDRSEDQKVARYGFFALGSTNDPDNKRIISKIREDLMPRLLLPLGVTGFVTGTLPYVVDENVRYLERTPLVFAAVLMLSMIFLLVAFRSVVVPVKAIILNLLSTGATFGILVILFQLSGAHHWHFGVIEGFVPALLFSILFGLSMDYHVIMLARVSEEVSRGRSTRDAVAYGITETSGAITSAAAIMISVFIVIASLELPVMKQLGVGLAVAVFIDATIIRTVLLPASMLLLGRINWYLPRFLEWMPRVRI